MSVLMPHLGDIGEDDSAERNLIQELRLWKSAGTTHGQLMGQAADTIERLLMRLNRAKGQ